MSIVAKSSSTALLAAIRELALYRDEDPVATAFNVGNAFYCTNEEWHRRNPKTPAEIMQHYRECVPGVAQQVFANYGIPGELALLKTIAATVRKDDTVLDFGAGIGSKLLSIQDCTCTHADVGGVLGAYAAWRYGYAGRDVEMIALDDDYMKRNPLAGRVFDLVICTEVIEHVTDPVALVALLASLVRPGGKCIATTSFDDGDGMVPMHLNIQEFDDESFARDVFPKYGLVQAFGGPVFVKE